ncbi:hypothetical protein TcasGA2_TC015646 [Tribolium castaneum]|uniref:Uncharacterized protein n=1 Tax=Tribolium castaneum TaxID=7070 RepID=D2A647_TRICA|nr:hypothetical protein TcasGA2_TC015646 [Tribolium castaneum]
MPTADRVSQGHVSVNSHGIRQSKTNARPVSESDFMLSNGVMINRVFKKFLTGFFTFFRASFTDDLAISGRNESGNYLWAKNVHNTLEEKTISLMFIPRLAGKAAIIIKTSKRYFRMVLRGNQAIVLFSSVVDIRRFSSDFDFPRASGYCKRFSSYDVYSARRTSSGKRWKARRICNQKYELLPSFLSRASHVKKICSESTDTRQIK